MRRQRYVIVPILLLFSCTCCFAAEAKDEIKQAEPKQYMVMINYEGDINKLWLIYEKGIIILNYIQNKLIALATEQEMDWLKSMDLKLEILESDSHINVNTYYIVYSLKLIGDQKELAFKKEEEIAYLSAFGKVTEYDHGIYLLKYEEGIYLEKILNKLGREYFWEPLSHKIYLPKMKKSTIYSYDSEKPEILIQRLIEQVSFDNISTHILYLQDAGEIPGWDTLGSRYSFNTIECLQKAEYIITQFGNYGIFTSYDEFVYNQCKMKNIIATQFGLFTSSYYIVCAHYDSYAIGADTSGPAPGADDNASGVSALLECARILSRIPVIYTVKYIAFSGEEQGRCGSDWFAVCSKNNNDNILGVINLDMIAYNTTNYQKVDIITNSFSEWLADAMIKNNTFYNIGLDTIKKYVDANIRYSDHASFWDCGYYAICGIENKSPNIDDLPYYTSNIYYHTPQDTLNKLNIELNVKITKLVLATLAELARVLPTYIQPIDWLIYQ